MKTIYTTQNARLISKEIVQGKLSLHQNTKSSSPLLRINKFFKKQITNLGHIGIISLKGIQPNPEKRFISNLTSSLTLA